MKCKTFEFSRIYKVTYFADNEDEEIKKECIIVVNFIKFTESMHLLMKFLNKWLLDKENVPLEIIKVEQLHMGVETWSVVDNQGDSDIAI